MTIPQLWKIFKALAEWKKAPQRTNPKLLDSLRTQKNIFAEITQNLWSTFRAILEQNSTNVLQVLFENSPRVLHLQGALQVPF